MTMTSVEAPMTSVEVPTTSECVAAELWRSVVPGHAEVRRARRRLHLKALVILGLVVTSYWAFVIADFAWPVRLAAGLVLSLALVAVGTGIMHDANHHAFSRHRRLNAALAYTSDALGASSWLWRIQHNTLHHANPNVPGFDADIALAPFARLAPSQPWHWWYRGQHVYIWPLYGFLALKNLLVSDVVSMVRGTIDGQPLRQKRTVGLFVRITFGKLFHLAWAVAIPLLFNPWWAVLAGYLACSWIVGFVLAIVFQLAHCVDVTAKPDADAARRGEEFTAHQMRTTANIASPIPVLGHAFRWLVGGLDHQIEHHLSPRLPHTLHRRTAQQFRAACDAHGVTYHQHPGVWSALRSHTRWLREMSARPRAAVAGVTA